MRIRHPELFFTKINVGADSRFGGTQDKIIIIFYFVSFFFVVYKFIIWKLVLRKSDEPSQSDINKL